MVNGYRRWMLYCPKFRLQQSVSKRDRPRSGQPKISFANDRFYSSTPLNDVYTLILEHGDLKARALTMDSFVVQSL
jgi:hypothetical protein